METVRRFVRDEEAPTSVEYAIMLGGIAAVIITTVALLGRNLDKFFTSVPGKLAH